MVQTWTLSANTVSSHTIRVKAAHANRRPVSRHSDERARAGFMTVARSLFFLFAFAILFSGFMLMRTSASSESVPSVSAAESVIYADAGDTLWSLASAVKKPSMDTRQAVHLLKDRNDLTDTSLHSGQMLIVPVEMLP